MTGLRASGNTHPGLLRDTNEDRFHYDPARGLFIVVDGVGGQAAGEKAAETALGKIRERLEQDTGTVEDRIRQAMELQAQTVTMITAAVDETALAADSMSSTIAAIRSETENVARDIDSVEQGFGRFSEQINRDRRVEFRLP